MVREPGFLRSKRTLLAGVIVGMLVVAYVGGVLHGHRGGTLPRQIERGARQIGLVDEAPAHDDDHGDHDADDDHDDAHEHATAHGRDHDPEASLELSPEALANLGLTPELIRPLATSTYYRHITVPAIVVERPGRTQLPVSAPITGVVTHVHAVTGEAVTPGTLLVEMRLTHEDLVTSQTELLQTVGSLEVEQKEIARLESASQSGALPGRVLLERQYARDKLLTALNTQREALRLHGLTHEQIERIETERRLLTEIRVYAPRPDDHDHKHEHENLFQLSDGHAVRQTAFIEDNQGGPADVRGDASSPLVVKQLTAHKGLSVTTGDVLCVLADYSLLSIEGQAFETDASAVAEAKRRGWKATAMIEQDGLESEIEGLEIAYLSNEIDPAARISRFYVALPNDVTEDVHNAFRQRFVAWKHRPGERMQLRVPVEQWADQLVLPTEAVVKEGPNSFVFQRRGNRFVRIAVHERYRDRRSVVIANDGSLASGRSVALRGAYQMQLAIRANAGGAVDPHAGHEH